MRKVKITIAALFFYFLGFSQEKKTSSYENKPLTLEEADFISGYYNQNGDHSAIMGGNGSEKLDEFSNTLDLKFVKKYNQYVNTFDLGLTAEHRTSASTAYIEKSPDGATTSVQSLNSKPIYATTSRASGSSGNYYGLDSKSHASALYGWRFNPSLNWSVKNLENNSTFGLGAYYSYEFDYNSLGAEISYAKASADNNREYSVKGQAFFDRREMILPFEVRPTDYTGTDWQSKTSFSLDNSYSQVVNQRLQFSVLADIAYQKGILATPYNRVYFNNVTVGGERLPDNRLKIPVGLRLNYFAGNNVIFRFYYRHYWDDWKINGNTASVEVPVKINPNFSVSPFYRFHEQTSAEYFNRYATANPLSDFYTSDYDLSDFKSNNIGVNFHLVPGNWGVFNSVDLRYSHYKRTDGLAADNITLALKFK